MTMKEDRSHMTERILNLTLEIIYLLTGEKYAAVKMASLEGLLQGVYPAMSEARSQDPTLVSPLTSLTSEKNERKILEVTNKMIKLLSGEVSGAGNSLAIRFSMEEQQCLEDHEELYKAAMMEDQPMGGARRRHFPETSLPPYFWDSTQEEHELPRGDQREILEELKCVAMDTMLKDDDPERAVTVKEEEEVCAVISSDGNLLPTLEGHQMLFPECGMKGYDITHDSVGESTGIPDICPELSISYGTLNPGLSVESSPRRPDPSHKAKRDHDKPFSCSECGKAFIRKASLAVHQRLHTGEHLFPCPECGKNFVQKSLLVTHQRTHTGEKPFSCAECGQSFAQKSNLVQHEQAHRGNKPFKCSECGKCFTLKWNLIVHERTHTGERPFQCLECGRSFTQKSRLIDHQRLHRGDKPFTCSECGRCFTVKANLILHSRTHTGEKPYECLKCGKRFSHKSRLAEHKRSQHRDDPF